MFTARTCLWPGTMVVLAACGGTSENPPTRPPDDKTIGPSGGTVVAEGSGASIQVPAGAITSGSIRIALADTFGVTGIYPAMADRAYRLTLAPSPGATFASAKDLTVILPVSRALATGEQGIVSMVIGGDTFWVSGSVVQAAMAHTDAYPGGAASRAGSVLTFAIPAPSLGVLGSHPGAAQGSTQIIVLPRALSLLAATCTANEYPTSQWEGYPPLGRAPSAKRPAPGDIGIVLVHGWDWDLGDCAHFATVSEPGEVYFKNLIPPLEAAFGTTHPIWAFTYPSFYRVSKSGAELTQSLATLLSTEQLSGVIIVAHSMGGLVARVTAEQLESNPQTKGKLLGIISLATPHRGAPIANPANRLFPFLGLGTPGSHDLGNINLLPPVEDVPIYAHSGSIGPTTPAVDPLLQWLASSYYALTASDGVVPVSSASPSFILKGKAYPAVPYDHSELHAGDDAKGLASDPLYVRIFTDIALLGAQRPLSLPSVWSGTSTQVNPARSGNVLLAYVGGTVGSVVGAIAYPSAKCGGTLTLGNAGVTSTFLNEHITHGACIDGGTINARRVGASLVFDWSASQTPGTTARAALTRVDDGGPDVPAGFGGAWEGSAYQYDLAASWSALLAVAHATTGTTVGLTAYPSLQCGGEITLGTATAGKVELMERIAYGPCADDIISLTMGPPGTLIFQARLTTSAAPVAIGALQVAGGVLPPAPAVPGALSATATSSTQVTLTWVDNATSESGFAIGRRLGGGPTVPVAVVGPDMTSYADAGLSSGAQYTYSIRAFNPGGVSAPSAGATVVLP
ncbi:MAG: hypothetical protein SF070_13220 [Gemmatimonadota bacterium]|nr:hypothetical protein [Gemmatimonadota bacterium]